MMTDNQPSLIGRMLEKHEVDIVRKNERICGVVTAGDHIYFCYSCPLSGCMTVIQQSNNHGYTIDWEPFVELARAAGIDTVQETID